MADAPILLWFRQDLRLTDNPALAHAVASGAPVIPVFILGPAADGRPYGAAALWWLDKSLRALDGALRATGSRLILRRGDPEAIIHALVAETGAGAVVWNRLYGGDAIARDTRLKADLRVSGIEARSCNAALLVEPWALKTGAGGAYKVYTPFWRAARGLVDAGQPPAPPARLPAPSAWPASDALDGWALHPSRPDWSTGFGDWTPGEAGAAERLDGFLDAALGDYGEARDRPAVEGTSRLSPHLHWGEIGPRQIWAAGQAAAARGQGREAALDKFLSEVGWREFNHHLLFAHPDLATANVRPMFDDLAWRRDPAGLEAWKTGQTGYPIVDAGMRQLWATGWMHNRVRLIVGSFLVKHLLVNWREGERWFWDTLVDACAANNPGNWQWVAGSGADASPFFRIFNPVTQGERFDGGGAYVRRWVPELARLPDAILHRPWTAEADRLKAAGVVLGRTYPKPIVDHAVARQRALDAFKGLRA